MSINDNPYNPSRQLLDAVRHHLVWQIQNHLPRTGPGLTWRTCRT